MTAPLIELRGVTLGYDQPILHAIDLEVAAGEIVVLLGGSGSGKSTLLRAMTGLLPPLEGEVLLFGEPLYELPIDERDRLLRRTGTAFQQDALFGSMSIYDNVALPLRELTALPAPVIREMVRMKLALVGLEGLERRLPTSLSGGQRKRAALARASILDPEVIFCDEPTAALDPAVAACVDETLLQFRSAFGMSLVVVSHEIESIRTLADRAVMIDHGTIHAAGTVDELGDSQDPIVFNFFHRVAGPPACNPPPAR